MRNALSLRLTDTAEADLAEIWAYIATEASEATASKFLHAVHATLLRLLEFPLSGPGRDQLGNALRVTFHGAYAAYYRVMNPEVVIVRVLHGARDAAAISERGGFD